MERKIETGGGRNYPQIIAFYLPQYHPTKENNEWYGPGFTEWTNVAKTKPLYHGHVQPKIPADLGFYDLRLPEIREQQAELAKEAGVTAFCYYHYWFGNGKKMLEKPLEEVVKLGKPDFPFCVCWANHSWLKKSWNASVSLLDYSMLIEQIYPGDKDIEEHFNYLLPIFKDKRYYKIDGRLVFVIYKIDDLPDFILFKNKWNELAKRNNLPEFYFISYTSKIKEINCCPFKDTDEVILDLLHEIEFKQGYSEFDLQVHRIKTAISKIIHKPLFAYQYKNAMRYFISKEHEQDNVIPVMIPNFDLSPRRQLGAYILKNASPELFYQHAKECLKVIAKKPVNKQIVFLKSWNEWGEGNYMEPDLQYGKGFIKALRKAVEEFTSAP